MDRTIPAQASTVRPPLQRPTGEAFTAVAALHLLGLVLLATDLGGPGWGILLSGSVFAYGRGVMHAFDFDHISVIDNSTRKFVTEGRPSRAVGFAFSLGHSTVVIAVGVLVASGASAVRGLLDSGSPAVRVLGLVGAAVSGLYLLLLAATNMVTLAHTWRVRTALRRDPLLVVSADSLRPRGFAAQLLAAPLRRVSLPRHVFLIGALFGLGFDTASTIGMLMVTTAAAAAGVPGIALMAYPILFAAGMTLGDTANGLYMVRLYLAAQSDVRRRIEYNLAVTGIGVVSAVAVAGLSSASLLADGAGVKGVVHRVASLDTQWAGYGLATVFLLAGGVLWIRSARRRNRPSARPQ